MLRGKDASASACASPERLQAIALAPSCASALFEHVYLDGCSHVEAFEMVRARDESGMTFGEFLRELHRVYRALADLRAHLAQAGIGSADLSNSRVRVVS